LMSVRKRADSGKEVFRVIPVQYREAFSEEVLGGGYEPEPPEIGRRVLIGREHYEVLYRWRGGPTRCVVYVRPVVMERPLATGSVAAS
jgi:hypothetical protein